MSHRDKRLAVPQREAQGPAGLQLGDGGGQRRVLDRKQLGGALRAEGQAAQQGGAAGGGLQAGLARQAHHHPCIACKVCAEAG